MTTHSLGLLSNGASSVGRHWLRPVVEMAASQTGSWPLAGDVIADPSGLAPVPREPDYLAETGRGLHVIGALSDTWGYTSPGAAGKVVWAMFRLSS